jgi:hypothetical protein
MQRGYGGTDQQAAQKNAAQHQSATQLHQAILQNPAASSGIPAY